MAAPRSGRCLPPGTAHPHAPVDFPFLVEQTFEDGALERELLVLFLDQARRLLPRMARMVPRERGETAHLLKGSCQGIGAWAAAAAAQAVEDAPARPELLEPLRAALAAAEAAIAARIAAP